MLIHIKSSYVLCFHIQYLPQAKAKTTHQKDKILHIVTKKNTSYIEKMKYSWHV